MKWLRSSLFQNNKDKFIFNEKLNIDLANFEPSLKEVNDVVASGILTRNGQDKIIVDLTVKGFYKMISSRTLNEIEVPFFIEEREEFVDKNIVYSDSYEEFSVMDMFLDLSSLINELIILNVPSATYLEGETVEQSAGNDWQLLTEEDLDKEEVTKENPFAALSDMFKEK